MTPVADDSPKHNVIVGRNGSGKSNFFDAIQFVLLGPRFASLRQEDRQHLLHEGAGSSVMAAYVEIIFDNSDGRLSIDSDEVVLRRTIGHKKDEFFLNRKRVQKNEVQNLLESAGFSKSNPYYIVQQGKVANLCLMKDKDRLNLLKEVAGTTVYEERRTETLKIMQETATKKQQIEEVLQFIDERLAELETEKEELTEYDSLDKQRRAIEYSLYDQELSKASERLQQIEVTRTEEQGRHAELHAQLSSAQDEVAKGEDRLQGVKASLERLVTRKAAKGGEVESVVSRRSSLEVELQEAQMSSRNFSAERKRLESSHADVVSQIADCERELGKIEPEFCSSVTRAGDIQQQIDVLKHRVDALYGKQGRGQQFSSKKDRDAFLQSQIAVLQEQVVSKEELVRKDTKEIDAEDARLAKESDSLQRAEAEGSARIARYEELTALIKARVASRNQLQEQRKTSWRQLEELQEQSHESKLELEKGKNMLNVTLPRHISQGLVAIEKIAKERGIHGYHGPIIDNFSLRNNAFRTAVEVAAGNALFHVVVDTDATAAIFMEELERRRAGRLTFLPLNRIRQQPVAYPDSNDVKPLIEVAIEYEPALEAAIKHVFGRKLLARDLETAAHFSKEFQLDAITKEGDVVNRMGAFEGGYHDERQSRIAAIQKIRDATARIQELSAAEEVSKALSEKTDNTVNDVMRELLKLESEREHMRTSGEALSAELASRAKHVANAVAVLASRRRGLAELQREITQGRGQVSEYKEEQKSPLLSKLSDAERAELASLGDEEKALRRALDTASEDVRKITSAREKLKADLKNNLYKTRDELAVKLTAPGGDSGNRDHEADLGALQLEKAHLHTSIAQAEAELDGLVAAIADRVAEESVLERSLEDSRAAERACVDELAEATKLQDKLLNKRTILLDTVQQRQALLRDLGTLPRKELDEHRAHGEKELLRRLKGVNELLKKYAGVNRKALDQYMSFNEQRVTLLGRKDELVRDADSIQKLVDSLDAQREEAILRTFRGVSHHFEEVFTELVAGGKGELVMRSALDDALEVEEGGGEAALTAASVSQFVGVQVRVTFAGSGQQFEMQQLSGGQKALVALALIFAIQRCDPAPFYLFDEIDQALDASYRANVAKLIQRQVLSEDAPAQFITTTFRPELVNSANKCYGIALIDKVSNIVPLARSEAQTFVTSLMQEEVDQVVAVPAYGSGRPLEDEGDDEEKGPHDEESDAGSDGGLNELADVGTGRAAQRLSLEEEEEDSDDEALKERMFDIVAEKRKPSRVAAKKASPQAHKGKRKVARA